MEAELNEVDFQPQSPSLDSMASVNSVSSVDDLIIEQKFQHKKKLIFIGLLILAGVVTAGVLTFGAHEATNGFDFDSNGNKITASMVLPNTTLEVDKITNANSKGSITFQPFDIEFTWQSIENSTDDIIIFTWESDSLPETEASDYYNSYFNGISGFVIDLKGDDTNWDGAGSGAETTQSPAENAAETSHEATLSFFVYKFDGAEAEVISMSASDDGSEGSEAGYMTEDDQNLLTEMIQGNIGEYFVQLAFKLASLEYTGDVYDSVKFIHNYAKFFYGIGADAGLWEVEDLEEALNLNNIIVLYNGNATLAAGGGIEIDTGADGSSRRLLSDPECCPSPGHMSANPYSRCGNPKFGMCGRDSDCWSWICGTCKCVDECHEHDWYCSCDSAWGFWCINVFWVGCSDQCWWQ